MSISIDIDTVFIIIQIVIVFMLVLGLPLAKGAQNRKNLIRHGYLTIFALVLHTVMVIIVMVLLAMDGFMAITDLPIPSLLGVVSHMIVGAVALGLGYAVIGFWLSKPLGNMNCYRAKKLMLPTLITWIVSLILGIIIHFFEIF
jgi:hypothetical protein